MYEYKFVKVYLDESIVGRKPREDYQEVIKVQAKDGWRLVQIFAPPLDYRGRCDSFDLIFEREISE